jgi:hypothetical protein
LDADDFPGPGVAPDEVLLPADPAISERSRRVLAHDAEMLSWRYGPSVLTRRSDRWGLIRRTDVLKPSSGTRSRIVVFWSLPLEDEGYGMAYYPFADPPLPSVLNTEM